VVGKKPALLGVSEKNYSKAASFLGGSFGRCVKKGIKVSVIINTSISD